jgi:hypothetical protein
MQYQLSELGVHIDPIYFYLLPLLPLAGRTVIVGRFWSIQSEIPKEEEQDREGYRMHILAFAGFSFLGVAAFAVVESSLRTGLSWAIYYLTLSFFSYMFSLNVVNYKSTRGQDQLATALLEVGTLSLFLAVVSTLVATRSGVTIIIAIIATFVWGADHTYRLLLDWKYQTKLLENMRAQS